MEYCEALDSEGGIGTSWFCLLEFNGSHSQTLSEYIKDI